MVDKQKVLADAPAALNRPDRPWSVTVQGDSIIAQWKWMDAAFFGSGAVSDEQREYAFIVTLMDNGKWHETDKTAGESSGMSFDGGSLHMGMSSQRFFGKKVEKTITFGFGKNKQTEETGVIGFNFDTSAVKKPIREYLESCGWKKPGLFG